MGFGNISTRTVTITGPGEALFAVMIIVRLDAGLGNQLFQYATARRLALRHSTVLRLDLSLFPAGSHRLYGLHRFNIAAEPARRDELEALGLLQPRLLARLRRPFRNYHHHKEIHPNFHPEVMRLPNRTALMGYFQSELYFKDVAGQLREELTFNCPLGAAAAEILRRILSYRTSVGLHVRRGDYVTLPEFGLLPVSYYQNAVRHLRSQLGAIPEVFVFFDDPEWCRIHLDLGVPFQVVVGNEKEPHDDLRLMSACRHNIIANSSFSWWGAWLNPNEEKAVIAPRTWFASWPKGGGADLIPFAWTRI